MKQLSGVLMAPIWVADPCGSVKPKNALPAVAVAVAAVETGVAAVETDVAAVETDVAAVETDAAVAVAAAAGAAASKMALETVFSRSPKIAPSLKDSLPNAIWRCKVVPCTR